MEIYNLSDLNHSTALDDYDIHNQYFIIASPNEFDSLAPTLGIEKNISKKHHGIDTNIRFISREHYDDLSFVYFNIVEDELIYEYCNIYLGKNYFACTFSENGQLHADFLEDFQETVLSRIKDIPDEEKSSYMFYRFLEDAFSNMFNAMYLFEDSLSEIEDTLLLHKKKSFPFEKIVEMKNTSFKIEKFMRLLMYVGDQLVANDNNLIPPSSMRYLHSIDAHTDRMYEYAKSIHESSEHLMELYNTAVNTRSNDLLNKLTVFTFFAMPLTILTGLYGMNFVNMPELQHPNGYFILLSVMATIIIVMFVLMKKIKLL